MIPVNILSIVCNQDHYDLKNWRPISLLNVDAKINFLLSYWGKAERLNRCCLLMIQQLFYRI